MPDQLDKYWQLTLDFLKIASEFWPAYLAETDRIEPAARRDQLIEAEAARLTRQSGGPVIAAGSTGSMPATARFLLAWPSCRTARWCCRALISTSRRRLAIDRRRRGSDRQLHHAAGIEPSAICDACAAVTLRHHARRCRDARQSLRRTAARCWHPKRCGRRTPSGMARSLERLDIAAQIAGGMDNLAVVEAANPGNGSARDCVAMREARKQNNSAALVTPDRALARRVTRRSAAGISNSMIPAATH